MATVLTHPYKRDLMYNIINAFDEVKHAILVTEPGVSSFPNLNVAEQFETCQHPNQDHRIKFRFLPPRATSPTSGIACEIQSYAVLRIKLKPSRPLWLQIDITGHAPSRRLR